MCVTSELSSPHDWPFRHPAFTNLTNPFLYNIVKNFKRRSHKNVVKHESYIYDSVHIHVSFGIPFFVPPWYALSGGTKKA